MQNIDSDLEVLEGLSNYAKVAFNAQLFMGNYKKSNCKNYNGSLCHAWTWKKEEHAKINQNFAIGNPVEEKGKLLINPDQFLCALCPKWSMTKQKIK